MGTVKHKTKPVLIVQKKPVAAVAKQAPVATPAHVAVLVKVIQEIVDSLKVLRTIRKEKADEITQELNALIK